ncbi:MAG: hypothetical protein H0W72_05785 [Planctomycetes bacterium]|nr:hypothetical protein [Planctomycetota bacterium]
MSDDDFPGFIEDDKPKKAKPAPTAPVNPFADVKVGSQAMPSGPKPAAKAPGTRPIAKSGAKPAVPATAPVNPFADVPVQTPAGSDAGPSGLPSAAGSADEAEIKPGQGKDLWLCPHCGAKNKAGRDDCRSCRKNPSEPVVVPWHQPLPVRIGLAVGALIVLIALPMLLFGGSVELKPAGAEQVDSAPRRGGSGGDSGDFSGKVFSAKKGYAVSGRVLAAQPTYVGGLVTVVLALGPDAVNDDVVNGAKVEISGTDVVLPANVSTVVINAWSPGEAINIADFAKGSWLSIKGASGLLVDGGIGVDGLPTGDIVRIDEHRTQ